MSQSLHEPRSIKVGLVESPWFWLMLFAAAALVILLAFSPKYAARQRRLEMQYYARQEITRRAAEGADTSGPSGADGSPPPAGELIIPLWPLLTVLAATAAVSAVLAWRATRRAAPEASPPGGKET